MPSATARRRPLAQRHQQQQYVIVNHAPSDIVTSATADTTFNVNAATHDASTNSLASVGAYSEFAVSIMANMTFTGRKFHWIITLIQYLCSSYLSEVTEFYGCIPLLQAKIKYGGIVWPIMANMTISISLYAMTFNSPRTQGIVWRPIILNRWGQG